jgi:hypothetical protein
MAKPLAVILKQYSDVISGKIPASKISALTTGKEPGVDYAGKMPDEREFVASHSVEKFPDRNGNGDDVFNASNIKVTEPGRHGHLPNPKSTRVYQQTNEAKDNREYDYEGEMAISQLKSIMNHTNQLLNILKPDTNLPEWVQSKITLGKDYIQTAADYMMTEMQEETDLKEGSKYYEDPTGPAKRDMTNKYVQLRQIAHKKKKKKKNEESEDAADEQPMYNGKDKEGKRKLILDKELQEKAESIVQQKLMAMALAHKRGEMENASEQVKKLANSMTKEQLRDFAETKHKGLPKRVQTEQSAPAPTPITFPVTNSREGSRV